MRHLFSINSILLFLLIFTNKAIQAQQYDCAFKPPVVKIDFGSGNIPEVNSYNLPKYSRDFSTCPKDGFYSFMSNTSNCFNGDWLTIDQDHTGTPNGNMMLVNASETGGVFFNTNLDGFTGGTMYQLTVWMMNVCRINGGCAPLPPNITINVVTPDGRKIGIFRTGLLFQGNDVHWKKFTGFFQTPADVTSLKLTMEDNTLGGCGNDFAMDDISISECVIPKPQVINEQESVIQKPVTQQPLKAKQQPVAKPQVLKKVPVKVNEVKRDTTVLVTKPTADKKPIVTIPSIKDKPNVKLPEPILTRANPIVKQIETDAGEILIDLYDNGEIDGDTVTIYHNNEMIVSRAGLSDKPISFHIKVDEMQPHHELVMVANNLGSIPPNTSIMIITANNKRYEVFISSSEQKNAKVVIDLKQ